jgi:hypothetical protein
MSDFDHLQMVILFKKSDNLFLRKIGNCIFESKLPILFEDFFPHNI